MNQTVTAPAPSKIELFLALSRTPHGLLDMATPCMAAILTLGALPPWPVIGLGLVTAFAAYTSVYALNDVVDHAWDREKIQAGTPLSTSGYIDAVHVRHPLAQGFLGLGESLAWTIGWGAVAVIGAWMLNPVCAAIFLGAAILEAVYCRMILMSHLRVFVSGVVKTAGPMAAVFAVEPSPSPSFVLGLFFWIYLWEIGGQNVPADLYDLEEDIRHGAKTVPVRYGKERSAMIVLCSLTLASLLGLLVFLLASPAGNVLILSLALLAVNGWLLLYPAWRLARGLEREQAMALFNKASFYPFSIFILSLAGLVL